MPIAIGHGQIESGMTSQHTKREKERKSSESENFLTYKKLSGGGARSSVFFQGQHTLVVAGMPLSQLGV